MCEGYNMPPPEWYAGYGPEGCHMDSPPMNGLLDTALHPWAPLCSMAAEQHIGVGGGASLSSPLPPLWVSPLGRSLRGVISCLLAVGKIACVSVSTLSW